MVNCFALHRFRSPNSAIVRLACFLLLLVCASCASLSKSDALQQSTAPMQRLVVLASGRHTLIVLPLANNRQEEWAYGEKLWFVDAKDEADERRQERWVRVGLALHALFWPCTGVVEQVHPSRAYQVRNPAEPLTIWEFDVTAEQVARMRAWLEASRAPGKPLLDEGESIYYVSVRRYHVFHTCTQYAACALRAGGVPVSPAICLFPAILWWQLDRLAGKVTELPPRPEPPPVPQSDPKTVADGDAVK